MTAAYPDILVIRHSETQWNRLGRLQGRGDSPLTLNGVRQALALAVSTRPHLPNPERSRFWVSPLGRARQTASLLADAWGLAFERFTPEPALAERAYGTWEGYSLDEVAARFPEQYAAHRADPWGYEIEGGESRTAFTSRIESWFRKLDRDVPHVIVVHSGCLRALRGIYTGADPAAILRYREPQTTSYWLSEGRERALDADPAVLRAFACEGHGTTVGI